MASSKNRTSVEAGRLEKFGYFFTNNGASHEYVPIHMFMLKNVWFLLGFAGTCVPDMSPDRTHGSFSVDNTCTDGSQVGMMPFYLTMM